MHLAFSVIEILLNFCGILAVELILVYFLKKAFISAVCFIGFVHSNSLPYNLTERKNGKPFNSVTYSSIILKLFAKMFLRGNCMYCTTFIQGSDVPTISIVGGTPAAAGEFRDIVILLFYSK